jgi:lysophospholipase L1-like esterase
MIFPFNISVRSLSLSAFSKAGITLIILLCISNISIGQAAYDSSYRFYYYDQKLSMFEKMPDTKNEIVWLGDSITDGGEWSELFPKQNTLNRGISSDNTFGVLHRLNEVTRRHPKKIFLLIGINDIARNIPVDVILGNYQKIVERIKQESPSTKIYIQTLLPTNNSFTNFPNHQNKTDKVLAVNNGLKTIAAKQSATLIDLYTAFLDAEQKLDKQYTNDGLHLMGAGYQHWKNILISNNAMQ